MTYRISKIAAEIAELPGALAFISVFERHGYTRLEAREGPDNKLVEIVSFDWLRQQVESEQKRKRQNG